jgi:hypothetical protein
MPNAPHNTTQDSPFLRMLDALDAQQRTGDPTNMILEQEARGQEQLVNSDVLPSKINSPRGFDVKAKMTDELGFKFGELVDGDPLFQHVELPKGWKKVADSGSDMWSQVVDEQGRERISIFYKAAFYDRDAFMNVKFETV